jgi:hypothetical protein
MGKKSHYDILIILQKEAIQLKPAVLQAIINIGEWRIKRMDSAYDRLIPINTLRSIKLSIVITTIYMGKEAKTDRSYTIRSYS